MQNTNIPLVSITVVTFNHKDYIKQCLDSILMQKTNFPFEIILGEDESNDGTREICIAYAEKYPEKIRLFLRSRKDVIYINGNATGRFNFIENLKACQGKYIALCEGDDYWTDPLKLQKQVDFLEANLEYSGCFHNTEVINEFDDNPTLSPWRTYSKNIFQLEDTISKTSLFHTSSFVFKKDSLNFPSWFTKVQSGDMAIFSIIASKGNLYRIDDYMSVYRKNTTGITNKISVISLHKNRIKLFNYLKNEIDNQAKLKADEIINYHKKELIKLKRNSSKINSIILKIKNRLKKIIG